MGGGSGSLQVVGDKIRISSGTQWEVSLFNERLKANSEIPENNIWEWMASVNEKRCLPFLPTIFKCCGFPLLAKNTSVLLANYQLSGVARAWNASN